MADDKSNELEELDLDAPGADLESALREAEAAVDAAKSGREGKGDGGEMAEGAEVDRMRREIADLRDRSMRTLADFDNFRKRSERERQDARRYALFDPLRDFVSVIDNLERALSAGGPAEDLKRGVEMILRQMQELLRRYGVKEVEVKSGTPFDPAHHEAMMRAEDPTVQVATVAEELQRGYILPDRLLRPAMVKVAVPAEGPVQDPMASSLPGGIPTV